MLLKLTSTYTGDTIIVGSESIETITKAGLSSNVIFGDRSTLVTETPDEIFMQFKNHVHKVRNLPNAYVSG